MAIKVFADNIIVNNGISRIETAIKRYSPHTVNSEAIEFVNREKDADLVIIYAYGQRRKVAKRIKWIGERGQKYAMMQLAIRSTANPNSVDWLPFWRGAEIVWSYYDLYWLLGEDGLEDRFNFYFAPLGVDTDIFKDKKLHKTYTIVVGGSRDESVTECVRAAKGKVYHLETGVTDEELVLGYNQSKFVSGLRRKEGFELPVLEGLLCGARPICYDRPHYRRWFGKLVEYIPEGTPEEVIHSLQKLFSEPPRPVLDFEKSIVNLDFNWKKLVKGFWGQL